MKIKFILLILFISGLSLSQDKQDWKYVHPSPQSNLLRKIKMIDENNWVASGANGLFMHTTNSGQNWYFQNFVGRVNSATLAVPQNYDLWFFNSNNGFVVGDQGYVGKTSDGGCNFDSVGTALVQTNSRCWSIWFADANIGYIGAGSQNNFTSRITKTNNGGANWTTSFSETSGSISYITALGGADDQTVCAAWANGTCIRTTNGGTSWAQNTGVFPSGTNIQNISFLNSTTGFACGSNSSNGVAFRTTDGGLTFTSLGTIAPNWTLFQIKIVSASEIYAVGDPSFLYKTTNLGDNWTAIPISVPGPATTFIWYSMDKYNTTMVMSGDYGIVAKSTDDGATWSTSYSSLTTQAIFDITTVPGTSKYWAVTRQYTSGTRQVLYSSNSGSSWTYYNTGVTADFSSVSMVNENVGYISGTNNRVLKTIDGGQTWTAVTGPSPSGTSNIYTCEFVNADTGFAFVNFSTVAGGNVFKTTNGGSTWSQYSTGATSENIYSADMVDANIGFCVMNSSNRPVYKTTNGGVNWTGYSVGTGFTGTINGVSAPDANTVYVCQTSGTNRVAKSTNGGVNWTQIALPAAADYKYIDFKDANTGYVSGNSTTVICRTTDGGATWTFQNTHNITNTRVFVSGGDTAWCAGGTGAIMRFTGAPRKINLNLTLLLEGMYDQSLNQMNRRDTVKAYLRSALPPYAIIDSASSVIDTLTFSGLFAYQNAPSGLYYIDVRYINTIETWSRSGGEKISADGNIYNYSFVSSSSKAYGDNMVQAGSNWCIYIGDVNQDGFIELTDIVNTFNDASTFVTGYVNTDVNGDNLVDLQDLVIVFNNASMFVQKIVP